MPTFTGTSSNDVITPQFVSPGVLAPDAPRPSDAADFILGGSGDDTLDGGGGADTIDGGPGQDSLSGGAGDDTFIWNPGGQSDVISGGGGFDTLQFNGANIGEKIDISANGAGVRVTRDIAAVTVDATSVEKVNVLAQAGADTITVHDLAGSGVKQVAVDFGQQTDGASGTVAVVGTAGADQFTLTSAGGVATVGGLSEALTVTHFENLDRIAVDGAGGADTFTLTGSGVGDLLIAQANNGAVRLAFGADNGFGADVSNVGSILLRAGIGDDTITAGNGLSTLSAFTFDGGAGNDVINGGDGADSVIGGSGNDTISGGRGNDTVSMGSGDDIFSWNPGDGSDVVDGGSGLDTLQFNGANINEKIDISLDGTGFRFTRDVANISLTGTGIEQVNFKALGGADTITVHDLAGSGVKQVSLDLFGSGNVGDGSADTVNITGAGAVRHFTFTASGGVSTIAGLAEKVSVTGAEDIDHVVVQGSTPDDTLTVTGAAAGDLFFAGANGTNATVGFNLPGETVEVSGIANVLLQGSAGADTMIGSNGVGVLTHFTFDGGGGDDSLQGTDGGDSLSGGAGDDTISGGRGNDTVAMGSGADTFIWNPGDGSDVVDGGSGFDTLQFNGANINEKIDISLNGTGFNFTRDVANISLTGTGIEQVNFKALGGADTITVHDLAGSGVKQVNLDLFGSSNTGDGSDDTVNITGAGVVRHFTFTASGGVSTIGGLAEKVSVTGAESTDHVVVQGSTADDTLTVTGAAAGDLFFAGANGTNATVGFNQLGETVEVAGITNVLLQGGAGADTMIGSNGVGTLTHFTFDGGGGDDSLAGTDGDDSLNGGSGDDTISGGRGNDTVAMGSGADTFVWNPGDGSDAVDGGSGVDTVQFNGANIGETFDISASGDGFRLTRDVANITLNGSTVETLNLLTRGGSDTVTLHDLTGSGLKQVAIDLAGIPGSGVGDTVTDTVVVEGSSGANHVNVTADGGLVVVSGLSETVTLSGAEADDVLVINGGVGGDSISASSVASGLFRLQLFGGAGDDTLAAGHGDDTLTGGGGDDRFSFAAQNGHDLVTDFEVHGTGGHGDVVALSGFVDHTFAAAVANHHILQVGTGVDITDGVNVIATLANVSLASLHANDFLFG